MPFIKRRYGRGQMKFRNSGQRIKNQVNQDQSAIANAFIDHEIVVGVKGQAATKILGNEVPVGAFVKMIAISVNMSVSAGTTGGTLSWYVGIRRSGQGVNSLPDTDWTVIGLADTRNQVFHSAMAIVGSEDASAYARTIYVKIPRIYQRIRAGDVIFIRSKNDQAHLLSTGARYYYHE